jgi:hypothetical protein
VYIILSNYEVDMRVEVKIPGLLFLNL